MASSLIFNIQSKYGAEGTTAAVKSLEDIRKEFLKTTEASTGFASGLSQIKTALVGGVLTLPFASFVRGAIDSEDAVLRLSQRLNVLGQNSTAIVASLGQYTQQLHQAGITQTELVQALTKGTTYFKSAQQELNLLDTAIGMTKVSGVSLAGAFQQLGLITQGYTRIARQYGVSVHSEIRNPTERTAAVLADMTKKMEELAAPVGSVSEAFKEMKVTITDIGETLGADIIVPLGALAKAFNKQSEDVKSAEVSVVAYSTLLLGVTQIVKSLGGAVIGVKALGDLNYVMTTSLKTFGDFKAAAGLTVGALGKLAIPLALIEGLIIALDQQNKAKKAAQDLQDVEQGLWEAQKKVANTRAEDLKGQISLTEDLGAKLKQLEQDRLAVNTRANRATNPRIKEEALAEKAKIEEQIKEVEGLERAKVLLGARAIEEMDANAKKALLSEHEYALLLLNDKYKAIKKSNDIDADEKKKLLAVEAKEQQKILDGIVKSQTESVSKVAQLRIAIMKDGLAKELLALQEKAVSERNSNLEEYRKNLDLQKAMAEKFEKDVLDIHIKYANQKLAKDLDDALLTTEERKKKEEDAARLKSILDQGLSSDALAKRSDDDKKFLKEHRDDVLKAQEEEEARNQKIAAARRKADEERMANAYFARTGQRPQATFSVGSLEEPGLAPSDISAKRVAEVTLKNEININVSPKVDEMVDAVTAKLNEFKVAWKDEMVREIESRLPAGVNP